MAQKDIMRLAEMLKAEDADRKAWDTACENSAKLDCELAEHEYDSIETDKIDMNTFGTTECEKNFDSINDIEEAEDTVNFSAYDLDEADDREPISHALDPIGVKASTANLVGQDAAQISILEAIKELTKAIKESKLQVNEKNLADIKGTIGNTLLQHRDEIFEQPTTEALRDFVKKLFDENGIDTPDSRKYIMKLQNMRNLGQAQIFINNIMMKSQNLGMTESAKDDAEFNTLLQKEKDLKTKIETIKRDIDSVQVSNLKKGIPADVKTEIDNLTSEMAGLEKTANDPTSKNKKSAQRAIKAIQGRIQKM